MGKGKSRKYNQKKETILIDNIVLKAKKSIKDKGEYLILIEDINYQLCAT